MGRRLGVIGIQGSDMFKIMAVPPIVALLSVGHAPGRSGIVI